MTIFIFSPVSSPEDSQRSSGIFERFERNHKESSNINHLYAYWKKFRFMSKYLFIILIIDNIISRWGFNSSRNHQWWWTSIFIWFDWKEKRNVFFVKDLSWLFIYVYFELKATTQAVTFEIWSCITMAVKSVWDTTSTIELIQFCFFLFY